MCCICSWLVIVVYLHAVFSCLQYSHSYEGCGLMLGAANLLVWFGVLRYFGFFADYNVSILCLCCRGRNLSMRSCTVKRANMVKQNILAMAMVDQSVS